ncbi:MAG: hypothetical protein EA387_14495, partial [Nitriliruptor sp.]
MRDPEGSFGRTGVLRRQRHSGIGTCGARPLLRPRAWEVGTMETLCTARTSNRARSRSAWRRHTDHPRLGVLLLVGALLVALLPVSASAGPGDDGAGTAASTSELTRLGALTLLDSGYGPSSMVLAPDGQAAYFGMVGEWYYGEDRVPGKVLRVDLTERAIDGTLELPVEESWLKSAVVDPEGRFAYFGTYDGYWDPWEVPTGRVVKVDLATFERVGALDLEDGEGNLLAAMVSPDGRFAYFSAGTWPDALIKIDLETFERVGKLTLADDESRVRSAVIAPDGRFAYLGTESRQVVRIDLETFQRKDAITLLGAERELTTAVIDPAGRYAYFGSFGTYSTPSRVVKLDLETFERLGAIVLDANESYLTAAVMDSRGDYAYFGTNHAPGRVLAIDLASFERAGGITLDAGEGGVWAAMMAPEGESAYFAAGLALVEVGVLTSPPLVFDDVPSDHPFHDEIAWMVQEGITTGFPDGTFRPVNSVTRQAAAAFLYRLAGEPPVTAAAGFTDVPTDHPFHDEIAWMVQEGITTGFPDGTFRPVNDVTRQAMAAFLYRFVFGEDPAAPEPENDTIEITVVKEWYDIEA